MKAPSYRALWVVATALTCVGCDQTTKLAARTLLPPDAVTSLFGDTVRLQLAANYGAFLSLGANLPGGLRQALLSIGVGCVLVGLFWYALIARTLQREAVLALSLMCGGGASNLLDRLQHGGYVVDFINVGVGPLRTGIFNVADMAIMLGTVLLLHAHLRERRSH